MRTYKEIVKNYILIYVEISEKIDENRARPRAGSVATSKTGDNPTKNTLPIEILNKSLVL